MCLANANRLVRCFKRPFALESKFRKKNFDAILDMTGKLPWMGSRVCACNKTVLPVWHVVGQCDRSCAPNARHLCLPALPAGVAPSDLLYVSYTNVAGESDRGLVEAGRAL